jgi:hypothetical protein
MGWGESRTHWKKANVSHMYGLFNINCIIIFLTIDGIMLKANKIVANMLLPILFIF